MDDLGRQFSVFTESFDLKRVRSRQFPFKCNYYLDSLGVDRVGTVVFAKPDEQERFSFNGAVIFEGQIS